MRRLRTSSLLALVERLCLDRRNDLPGDLLISVLLLLREAALVAATTAHPGVGVGPLAVGTLPAVGDSQTPAGPSGGDETGSAVQTRPVQIRGRYQIVLGIVCCSCTFSGRFYGYFYF